MDKRVLLFIAISMAIMFGYQKLFLKPPAEAPAATVSGQPSSPAPAQPAPATANAPAPATNAPAANAPATNAPAPATNAPAPAVATPPAAPAERPAEVTDVIEMPGLYRATFSSYGAAPTSWVLLKSQFQEHNPKDKKKLRPIDLVRTQGANLPLLTTFPQSSFTVPADAAWTKQPSGHNELIYTWENPQVRVEKHYTFPRDTYEVKLRVTVENKSAQPVSEHLQVQMAGWQDPSVKPSSFLSQRVIQTEGLCLVNGKLKRADLQSLFKEAVNEIGQVRFVGIDEKFFVQALAAAPDNERRCWVSGALDGTISSVLLTAEQKIEARQKATHDFAGYFGPKFLHALDAVTVGGQDAKLGDTIAYGWTEAIARPMLAVLKAIHVVVPNWGFAVIVLTILLKAVTWYPNARSMKSMRAMAKLKPEIDKLKEKCGDDKQRFNLEVMNLYKQRGVSPLGGCLPMLIQMPIYIAFYSMLGNSVELYRSSFLFWIQDLTASDPYFVTPLLTGVLMFLQQRFSPTPPDPQQKAMMYMMPIMFTGFSIFLPAGLTIYILTNTLLTMLQQWLVNRGQKPDSPVKPAGKPAPAGKPVKA